MARTPRPIEGRVVAITGGGRGIGRATAAALLRRGARVAIGDIEPGLAERTAAELAGAEPAGRVVGLALDVTDPDSFARFLDATEAELGPLDVLVNNAGIMPVGPLVTETAATQRRLVDINLHGVINGSKLALARFEPRGRGHLVNIASIAGKVGIPGGATYCATKHAVVGLSETIRREVRGSAIDVSIVMPTVVNTELGSGLVSTRGLRTAEPEDVAEAIAEALGSGRVEVYVPRQLNPLVRSMALATHRVVDLVVRLMRVDRVLAAPDHRARAAYEARTGDAPGPAASAATPLPSEPAGVG